MFVGKGIFFNIGSIYTLPNDGNVLNFVLNVSQIVFWISPIILAGIAGKSGNVVLFI